MIKIKEIDFGYNVSNHETKITIECNDFVEILKIKEQFSYEGEKFYFPDICFSIVGEKIIFPLYFSSKEAALAWVLKW